MPMYGCSDGYFADDALRNLQWWGFDNPLDQEKASDLG
jgi:hypothetical protein